MESKMVFSVESANAEERVDTFLAARLSGFTRSMVQKLLEEKMVTVSQKAVAKNYKLRGGDILEVTIPELKPLNVSAENIPLRIVYEDDQLLVVNKPKGMVVHPGAGNQEGTLVNALLHHCEGSLSGINGTIRPGIVHRIDKDTSGLLLVAKTNEAHLSLAQQLANHTIKREYHAVAYGVFHEDEGEIDAPIGRCEKDRMKMAVNHKHGKPAVTTYHVLERLKGFTYLSLRLKTGRTHQIRVHLSNIGHPLAGDFVYGPKKAISELCGQCLHAKTIGFIHPSTGEYMEFDSELPAYFTNFLERNRGLD